MLSVSDTGRQLAVDGGGRVDGPLVMCGPTWLLVRDIGPGFQPSVRPVIRKMAAEGDRCRNSCKHPIFHQFFPTSDTPPPPEQFWSAPHLFFFLYVFFLPWPPLLLKKKNRKKYIASLSLSLFLSLSLLVTKC